MGETCGGCWVSGGAVCDDCGDCAGCGPNDCGGRGATGSCELWDGDLCGSGSLSEDELDDEELDEDELESAAVGVELRTGCWVPDDIPGALGM